VPEVAARLPEGSEGSEGAVEVAVRLTGDRELRRLNRSFLGHDEVTDVLAFPSGEAPHLGDIALSVPTATRQAASFGHGVEAEVALLCVHGFLHLLGWDHSSPGEAAEMNRLTVAALDGVGVSLSPARLTT
jgi:probable rRNA maturation factor